MSRRFFAPHLGESPQISLSADESRHLRLVLRARVDDRVILFDGRGTEATARICAIDEGEVKLEILDRRTAPAPSLRPVTLATAVPKGERFDWLVEKATELGVRRLIPLSTSRSVVEPGAGKLDRLRRTIVEASKQCRRSDLMELTALTTWREFLSADRPTGSTWIADPAGVPWSGAPLPPEGELTFVIGPEGGFTDQERESATEAGIQKVALGTTILRIETAALLLAGLAQHTPQEPHPQPPAF